MNEWGKQLFGFERCGGEKMKLNQGRDVLKDFLTAWGLEDEYLIYGTSTTAQILLSKMQGKLKIKGCLDSDKKMWGKSIHNYRIFSIDEWKKHYLGTKIIVASGAYTEIRDYLEKEGLREQKDFCDSRFLMGSYFAVTQNKVYLYRTDFSITERCNLRCKKCNMLMPYYKDPKHKPLEVLKDDVDAYFQWVDYVQLFNILGGEPFLYPQVEEITEYICDTYGDRIGRIEFFTNGLPKLTESMLKLMQRYGIHVQVSDYRHGIPAVAKRVDDFMDKLKKNHIPYRRNIDNKWLDFGFPDYTNGTISEMNLTNFFDRCYSPFRGLCNKRLYYCHLNTSAVCAGLFKDDSNDYFDMEVFDEARKMDLVRFDLGYTQKGYITYCRKCKGCFAVNDEYTKVAEQMKMQKD